VVIIISIVSSASRPELWLDWYSCIGDNNIDFEVVFVGPNTPDFILPDNFHFIKTDVKPTQCWEIATRYAIGEYLVFLGDDIFFDTPNPLDKLYKTFISYNTEKLMLSCQFKQILSTHTRVYDLSGHKPEGTNIEDIILPSGFMLYKNYYRYLGGLDSNFIGLYWDLDLCFRVLEDNGITKLSDVWVAEQVIRCKESDSLYWSFGINDREEILRGFWPTFNTTNELKRTKPIEPFLDYNILTESQGPKGRWV